MSKGTNEKRGIFELENATGKNSTCEGFGQKSFLENHTLPNYELTTLMENTIDHCFIS
jgi:hypothetical protein